MLTNKIKPLNFLFVLLTCQGSEKQMVTLKRQSRGCFLRLLPTSLTSAHTPGSWLPFLCFLPDLWHGDPRMRAWREGKLTCFEPCRATAVKTKRRERTSNTHGCKVKLSCEKLIIPHPFLPSPSSPHEPFRSAGSLPETFFKRFAADVIIIKCTIRGLWYLSVFLNFNFYYLSFKDRKTQIEP